MKLIFKLQKEDYLTHQLYLATYSSAIKYKQETLKWMFALIYVSIGILFFVNSNSIWQGALFIVLGIIWFVFFPKLYKKRYQKSYTRLIDENFKEVLEKEIVVGIDKKGITTNNGESEVSVGIAEVDSLIELKELLLLNLKSGMTMIIPKRALEDVNGFILFCSQLGILHKNQVSWTWN